MKVWCLDFDGVIANEMTLKKHRDSLAGPKDFTDEDIRKNLKFPTQLAAFIQARKEAGDHICIVTYNTRLHIIYGYLRMLLGDDWKTLIPIIEHGTCNDIRDRRHLKHMPEGKSAHIDACLDRLGLKNPDGSFTIHPDDVVLIDDTHGNCLIARYEGCRAVQVSSDDSHLAILASWDARTATPEKLADLFKELDLRICPKGLVISPTVQRFKSPMAAAGAGASGGAGGAAGMPSPPKSGGLHRTKSASDDVFARFGGQSISLAAPAGFSLRMFDRPPSPVSDHSSVSTVLDSDHEVHGSIQTTEHKH